MTASKDPRHDERFAVTLSLTEWRNIMFMLSLFKRTLEMGKQAPGAIEQVEAAIAILKTDQALLKRLIEVGLMKEKRGSDGN